MTRVKVLPVPSPITIPDLTSATALLARACLKESWAAELQHIDYINDNTVTTH